MPKLSSLKFIKEENITNNVAAALDCLDEPKRMMLEANEIEGHNLIHLLEVLHCKGSNNYEK